MTRTADVVRLVETVGRPENKAVAQRIADNAITLVRDDRKVLPLRPSPDLRVVQINVLDTPGFANFLADTRAALHVVEGLVTGVELFNGSALLSLGKSQVWLDKVGAVRTAG